MSDGGPSWRRLARLAGDAHGALWEKIIVAFSSEKYAKGLWQLAGLHSAKFAKMKRKTLWEHLLVPIINSSGELQFRTFKDLPSFPFAPTPEENTPLSNGEITIAGDPEMSSWKDVNDFLLLPHTIENAILGMATLILKDGGPAIEFQSPTDAERAHHGLFSDFSRRRISAMCFGDGLNDVLAVSARKRIVNFRHPVITYLSGEQYKSDGGPLFQFLHNLAFTLTEPEALEALANQDFGARRQNWQFNLVGYYWRVAEAQPIPPHLSPPYRCWTASHGFFDITLDTLQALADVQVIDWRRAARRPIQFSRTKNIP
jgi:hypothetical protein